VRRLGLLVTPEEAAPPAILRRTADLARDWTARRSTVADPVASLATDPGLWEVHVALLPPTPTRRKGDYDLDLLVGLAKLEDAATLDEAVALLSPRETRAVLGQRAGLARLRRLVPPCPGLASVEGVVG
jgi:membrane glycosyltransferase